MSTLFTKLSRLSETPRAGTYTLSYGPIDHSSVIDIDNGVEYMCGQLAPSQERIIWEESTRLAEKVKVAILATEFERYNAVHLTTSCAMNSINRFEYTISFTLYRLQ